MRKIINNKGFTLVELVVVIAIIAILTTVSIVGYNTFVKNANQSKVDQELAQVNNVLRIKAIDGKTIVEKEDVVLTLSLSNNMITFTVSVKDDADSNVVKDDLDTLLPILFHELLAEVDLEEFANLNPTQGQLIVEKSGSGATLKYHIVRRLDTEEAKIEINVVNQLPEPGQE